MSDMLLLRAWPGAGECGRPGQRADGRLQLQNLLGRLARCLPLSTSSVIMFRRLVLNKMRGL